MFQPILVRGHAIKFLETLDEITGIAVGAAPSGLRDPAVAAEQQFRGLGHPQPQEKIVHGFTETLPELRRDPAPVQP